MVIGGRNILLLIIIIASSMGMWHKMGPKSFSYLMFRQRLGDLSEDLKDTSEYCDPLGSVIETI